VTRLDNDIAKDVAELIWKHFHVTPPVDLARIARELGIIVKISDLGYRISGFYTNIESKPVIVLNKRINASRQRFTLAHEIGHYLLSSQIPESTELSTCRLANEFAAHLLMPEGIIRGVLSTTTDFRQRVKLVKSTFQVSTWAAQFRIQEICNY